MRRLWIFDQFRTPHVSTMHADITRNAQNILQWLSVLRCRRYLMPQTFFYSISVTDLAICLFIQQYNLCNWRDNLFNLAWDNTGHVKTLKGKTTQLISLPILKYSPKRKITYISVQMFYYVSLCCICFLVLECVQLNLFLPRNTWNKYLKQIF